MPLGHHVGVPLSLLAKVSVRHVTRLHLTKESRMMEPNLDTSHFTTGSRNHSLSSRGGIASTPGSHLLHTSHCSFCAELFLRGFPSRRHCHFALPPLLHLLCPPSPGSIFAMHPQLHWHANLRQDWTRSKSQLLQPVSFQLQLRARHHPTQHKLRRLIVHGLATPPILLKVLTGNLEERALASVWGTR